MTEEEYRAQVLDHLETINQAMIVLIDAQIASLPGGPEAVAARRGLAVGPS